MPLGPLCIHALTRERRTQYIYYLHLLYYYHFFNWGKDSKNMNEIEYYNVFPPIPRATKKTNKHIIDFKTNIILMWLLAYKDDNNRISIQERVNASLSILLYYYISVEARHTHASHVSKNKYYNWLAPED